MLLFVVGACGNSDQTGDDADFPVSGVELPTDFRNTLVQYAIVERRDGTIRDIYINEDALTKFEATGFLPDDTIMVIEGYDGLRDEEGELVYGEDGHLMKGEPLEMIHVAHQNSAWQDTDFVDDTRLGRWNFGSFDAKTFTPFDEPIAPCFQCHSPHGGPFTLNFLRAYERTGDVYYEYCDQTGRSPCASMTR